MACCMTHYSIAVLPGDGTGREVMAEGCALLDAIEANTISVVPPPNVRVSSRS